MDPELLWQMAMMRNYLATGEGSDPFSFAPTASTAGYNNIVAGPLDKKGNPEPWDLEVQAKAMNATQDWADISSDPAVLGGMYGQMPGESRTTYTALPGQQMLSNAASMQGTLEQVIADEILNGGSAASAITKIRKRSDPNSPEYNADIAGLVPTYTEDVDGEMVERIDEDYVRDLATQFQNEYLKDPRAGANLGVDPTTGLLSSMEVDEDPLAAWYRKTGTPLPNEQYSPDMLASEGQLAAEQKARERFRGTDPNGMPPMGAAQAELYGTPTPEYGGGSSQAFNKANAAVMRYLLGDPPSEMERLLNPRAADNPPPAGSIYYQGTSGAERAALGAAADAAAGLVRPQAQRTAHPTTLNRNTGEGMDAIMNSGVSRPTSINRNSGAGMDAIMSAGTTRPPINRNTGAGMEAILNQDAGESLLEPQALVTPEASAGASAITPANRRGPVIPEAFLKARRNAAKQDLANRGTLRQNSIDQQVRKLMMNELAAAGHTPYNDTMAQRRAMAQYAGFGI